MKTLGAFIFVLFLTLLMTACFAEKRKSQELISGDKNQVILVPPQSSGLPVVKSAAPQLLSKQQREAIYFSASLEKEALKILTKNPSFDEMTLFSVLSYALETSYGVKKSPPTRLDCSRFRFAAEPKSSPNSASKISVFKTCQRPESLITEIDISRDQAELDIKFLAKEWIPVLGLSATLSGDNVQCRLHIENKKLASLSCVNWIRTLGVTNTSAEELRLKTFIFDRKNAHQFVLKGGLYKDLVERKKIEIDVPLEGKIKRFEKEIEFVDQYADSLLEAEKPAAIDPAAKPSDKSTAQRMQVMPVAPADPATPVEKIDSEEILETQETPTNGGVPPNPLRRGR